MATLADLVGVDPPPSAKDSYSLLPLMRGQGSFTRAPVIHHSVNGMFAIRNEDWKLVLGNGSGGRETPRGSPFQRPYGLFNLRDDPQERDNQITKLPEVARRLEASALEIIGDDR
jgi:arylsulfatase A-like enzyme